jgi:hypothetical protein
LIQLNQYKMSKNNAGSNKPLRVIRKRRADSDLMKKQEKFEHLIQSLIDSGQLKP